MTTAQAVPIVEFPDRPAIPFAQAEVVNDYRPAAKIRVQPDRKWVHGREYIHFEVDWFGEPKTPDEAFRYRQAVMAAARIEAQLAIEKLGRIGGWKLWEQGPMCGEVFSSAQLLSTIEKQRLGFQPHTENQLAPSQKVALDANQLEKRAYVVFLWFIRPADLIPIDPDAKLGYEQGFTPEEDLPKDIV